MVNSWSQEFIDLMEAVSESGFHTKNPQEACIFVPAIDILSEKNLDVDLGGVALRQSANWNEGQNNILFKMYFQIKNRFPICHVIFVSISAVQCYKSLFRHIDHKILS